MKNIISDNAIKRRTYWVEEIRKLSGNFGDDTDRLEKELEAEVKKSGVKALIDHLRLCGSIPESYIHLDRRGYPELATNGSSQVQTTNSRLQCAIDHHRACRPLPGEGCD